MANRFDLIGFEDLNASTMIRGLNQAKSMSDAGWGMIRQMVEYKQQNRSQRLVKVPSKSTTQECSQCHKLAVPRLELDDREFRSTACSHVMDRDVNAAKNVLTRSLVIVGSGRPESTPVETGPTLAPSGGRRVRALKQEPPRSSQVAL